jgi:hypothetical protein
MQCISLASLVEIICKNGFIGEKFFKTIQKIQEEKMKKLKLEWNSNVRESAGTYVYCYQPEVNVLVNDEVVATVLAGCMHFGYWDEEPFGSKTISKEAAKLLGFRFKNSPSCGLISTPIEQSDNNIRDPEMGTRETCIYFFGIDPGPDTHPLKRPRT